MRESHQTGASSGGGIHEIGSSQFSAYRRVDRILAFFATQPSASGILGMTRARLHKPCIEMRFSATRGGGIWLAKTKMTNGKSASGWRLLSMRMVLKSKR